MLIGTHKPLTLLDFSGTPLKPISEAFFGDCVRCEVFHKGDTLGRLSHKMPPVQAQESYTGDECGSLVSVDEGMRLGNPEGVGGGAFKCVSILILPLVHGSL